MIIPSDQTIRRARLRDAEAISTLVSALSLKFIAHEFSEEGRTNLLKALSSDSIRGAMRAGCRYHVHETKNEIDGVVATRGNRHLLMLFVAETAQGRGVGRALWDTARRASERADYRGPFTVSASRGAVRIYERFGFIREGDETSEEGIIRVPMRTRDVVAESYGGLSGMSEETSK